MPDVNNSPNPANSKLRPTLIDNYADNALPNHPSKTEQPVTGGKQFHSTPESMRVNPKEVMSQYPASNVARFDGLHRDQANADKQTIDVGIKDQDKKYNKEVE